MDAAESMPLVSILIDNYNYGRFLDAAIASALDQTYANLEVVVVDDGSTDDSREIMARYGDRIIAVFKANGGQASALNAGFAASRGEIICLLDADDLCLPDKVFTVVQQFQPGIDWVFHESIPFQSTDIENMALPALYEQVMQRRTEHDPETIDFRANLRNAELPNFTPSTSNLCLSRTLASQIFPLPEIKGFSGAAINDFYIKYLAVGLNPGCSFKKDLGIFRVHSDSTFSSQGVVRKRKVYAEIYLSTAYWMRVNFPEFAKLSHKLFSKGLANYFKSKDDELDYRQVIREYFAIASYAEKFELSWKSLYYFVKLGFTSLV